LHFEMFAGVKVADVMVDLHSTPGRGDKQRKARQDIPAAVQGYVASGFRLRQGFGGPVGVTTSAGPGSGRSITLRTPDVKTLENIDGASGVVAPGDAAKASALFPDAARWLGGQAVAAIARMSHIVGMRCPGRDSLLTAADLEIDRRARSAALCWAVSRVDRRFGLVRTWVGAEGVRGRIDAFLRPPPVDAIDLDSISARVTAGEFSGQRALVIGGSRGLGATTAAVIACGGGTPLFTYARGADDAGLLTRRLAAAGHDGRSVQFDIHDDPRRLAELAAAHGMTHAYYFPTPRIFARRVEPFDERLYHFFSGFYVDAFARICAALHAVNSNLTVFYPSTTALDVHVRELTEYAAAKAAGEALCRGLVTSLPGIRVVWRRLPRVSTDQTQSIVAVAALDPIDAVLPIVRDMQRPESRERDA
jgi:hypothetical protein